MVKIFKSAVLCAALLVAVQPVETVAMGKKTLGVVAGLVVAGCTSCLWRHDVAALWYGYKNDDIIGAAKANDWSKVKELVGHWADINARGEDGWTVLHTAVQGPNPSLEIVKYLVEQGGDPNAKDKDDCTVLHAAVLGPNPSLEIVKYLVEHEADLKAVTKFFGWTVLHAAVLGPNPSLEIVRYLVEEKKVDLEAKDKSGQTVLHAAVRGPNPSLEIVKYLVEEKKANVNAKDKNDWTVLHAAVDGPNSSLEIVRYLVKKGVDVNAQESGSGDDDAALCFAVAYDKLEIVKYLVEDCNVDLNPKSKRYPEVKDTDGRRPLELAVNGGNLKMLEYLLAHGANANAKFPSTTPILYHAASKSLEMVKLFIEYGADPKPDGKTATTRGWVQKPIRDYLQLVEDFYAVNNKQMTFDEFAKKHLINANMVVYFDAKTLYEKIKATKQLNEQKLEEVKKYLENVALNFETDNKAKVFAKYAEEYLVNERVIRHANLTDVYNLLHLGTKEFFDEFVEFTKKYKLLNFGDEDGNEKEWMLFDCAWRIDPKKIDPKKIDPKKIDPKEDFWFKECCQLLGDKKTEFDATVGESINKLRQEEEEARKSLEIGDPKKLERAKSEDLKKVKNMILQQKTGYLNIPKNIRMPNVEVKKEPGDDSKKKLINVKIDFKFKEPQL